MSSASSNRSSGLSPETVVIVSEGSDFAARLSARWQQEARRPDLAALKPQSFLVSQVPAELVVVEEMRPRLLVSVLERAAAGGRPVLCVLSGLAPEELRRRCHRVIFLRRQEGWLDQVAQIGGEVLRRAQAVSRLRRAEQNAAAGRRDAVLGRYMLEMRHNLNNALTSVLGNAELLLLEQDRLPQTMREQLEVVHGMTMRMHEIMQRFSSLEMEMRFAERESPAPVAGGSPAVDHETVTV